jgi:Lon protease-like protein
VDPGGFDASTFSGTVPLFPLPNVVLFPHAFLPLHIFEPRYRAMTSGALGGERLIGMALFKPGWEGDYYGNPAVHDVIGVGKIVEEERQEDGRYNLILYGVARARIVQIVSNDPYRTAKVELLEDRPEMGGKYERLRRLLLQFYAEVLKKVLKGQAVTPPDDLPLGALCDLVSAVLGFDPPVKQSLLEDLDVGSRCDRLVSLLQDSDAPGFGPVEGRSPRPWPPGPSVN